MAVIGAAGMFAVSIYTQIMGGYYDGLISNLSEVDAGRAVIKTTLYNIALIVIFAGIHFYMRGKKKLNYLELNRRTHIKSLMSLQQPCAPVAHLCFGVHGK